MASSAERCCAFQSHVAADLLTVAEEKESPRLEKHGETLQQGAALACGEAGQNVHAKDAIEVSKEIVLH